MSLCQSCGGVIGRDCFNPEECMAITRDQADRYVTAEQELYAARAEADLLRQQLAELIPLPDVVGDRALLNEEMRAMPESFDDQLSRVRLMSEGDPTWDLSPNDQTALKAVLALLKSQEELLQRAIKGLKYLGQFHYPESEAADPHSLDCSLAGRVSRVFCTGMTRSIELCRRFGENPEFNEAAERKQSASED